MRCGWRFSGWRALGLAALTAVLVGATPAPSYRAIEKRIESARADWAEAGASQPNAPGWDAFFDATLVELRAYSTAEDSNARLKSLDRLYRMSIALGTTPWRPAAEVREALRAWLRPRVALAWAERRLIETVRGLPATGQPGWQANREKWLTFVDDGLEDALRDYESAGSVAVRQEALGRLRAALGSLRQGPSWSPSTGLAIALADLFDRPNFDATADLSVLGPVLNRDPVKAEVIFFKGQTSYVTPGPRAGFGLLPIDGGIAFYNRQYSSAYTPIRGFQQQIASDPRGKRAANLYQFNASTTNQTFVTAIAVLTPDGLLVRPDNTNNVNFAVGADPIPGLGKHLTRTFAGLLGFNKQRIVGEIYKNAVGRVRQEAAQGAAELAAIKTADRSAQVNAQLRQYLVGNRTALYGNYAVTGLTLASQPQYAMAGGTFDWRGPGYTTGADAPQPPEFHTIAPGLTADLHLPSVLSNLLDGALSTPDARGVSNILLRTQGSAVTNPADRFRIERNVDFATFAKAVAATRETEDPDDQAVRISRPAKPPEFAADADGNLVAVLRDVTLEVAAPPAAARGGVFGAPAKIYRIEAKTVELAITFAIVPPVGTAPARVTGKIVDFFVGPGSKVFAIDDDEGQASELNAVRRTTVLVGLTTQLQNQAIDTPLTRIALPGNLVLRSVSALDPSGWIRASFVVGVPMYAPSPFPVASGFSGSAALPMFGD